MLRFYLTYSASVFSFFLCFFLSVFLRGPCEGLLAGSLDGAANPQVGPTAAEVARHGGVDLGIRGSGVLLEQGRGRHDLARLAVAALGDVFVDPRLLNGVEFFGAFGQALDGADLAVSHTADADATGADGLAVEEDRAGSTLPDPAAVFGAHELKPIPEHPQEGRGGVEVGEFLGFSVYLQFHRVGPFPRGSSRAEMGAFFRVGLSGTRRV